MKENSAPHNEPTKNKTKILSNLNCLFYFYSWQLVTLLQMKTDF